MGVNQTITYVLLYSTLATVAYFGVTWSLHETHRNFLRVG